MMKIIFSLLCLISFHSYSQDEPVVNIEEKEEAPVMKVFYSQKLINSKTVEVLRKGVLEFNVSHNFGDIAGDGGGITRFFGLDNATDVKIGFQTGLSDRLNLVTARTRGAGLVQQQWELGLKWQLMKQAENDKKHPLSMTIYANNVMSTQKRSVVPNIESSFKDFGSRQSQLIQLMVAKKMGKVSLQFSPLFLHTNYVEPNDENNIFAIGAGMRLPLSQRIVIIADWFHSFRSSSTEDYYSSLGMDFHDPIGIGLEILTEGHIFHLNFTNATELLENRFLRRTVTSWGDGQYRWSFTIARNFVLFRDK
jgi:hypothetical protein